MQLRQRHTLASSRLLFRASVKMQQGSLGEDPGVELCWAVLTLWQAVSCLCTANCVDATSRHEDKRHYSTQGFRAITQPSTRQSVVYALQTVQMQQAGMKTKDTTALKVPGRSLSRVLVEPNPI